MITYVLYYHLEIYFFSGIYCIRINSLDVPSAATVGTEVRLFCDYDLERQGLYQIKWYKGSHEFYRYSPGETTKKKSFLVNNLNVDVSSTTIIAFFQKKLIILFKNYVF